MNQNIACGIIDVQRGFMPASEGERLGMPGFGELPVAGGERIVPFVNALLAAAAESNIRCFTTQDWHPAQTAHFSEQPNFINTWPVHCVADTPGAARYPGLVFPAGTVAFYKGQEVLERGEDDTSYSAIFATNEASLALPAWVDQHEIDTIYAAGLALGDGDAAKLCVDSSAIDFRKHGLDVTVVTDAVEAVRPENRALCFQRLGAMGIRLMTTQEAVEEINSAREL